MKSYRKELWFNIPSRRAFVNITPQVEECLKESGISEGLILINAMHITTPLLLINNVLKTLTVLQRSTRASLKPYCPPDK